MFFVFSKLLIFFVYPFSWVLALLIATLIIKNYKFKRRLLIAAVTLTLIFSNPFLIDRFAKLWDTSAVPLKNSDHFSCAIVLGGFAGEDANGNGFFSSAADRFIQGMALIDTKKVSHILVSGGNGNLIHDNFAEGPWAKTQLIKLKIPDSCILIEDRSRNTLENAAFSKSILTKAHLEPPYLLVTSAFHMRRSLGIFKKAGIDVIPYPCNYVAGNGKSSFNEFIPDVDVFSKWNMYIKEVIGTIVNYFK